MPALGCMAMDSYSKCVPGVGGRTSSATISSQMFSLYKCFMSPVSSQCLHLFLLLGIGTRVSADLDSAHCLTLGQGGPLVMRPSLS